MVIYDSWLAKKLLKHPLGTIMLFGFILTKVSKEIAEKSLKMRAIITKHECYVEQYIECSIMAIPFSLALIIGFKSLLGLLLIPTMFYMIYAIDYFVKFIICTIKYRELPISISSFARVCVCFEVEAEDYEDDMYLIPLLEKGPPRQILGWMKYLFVTP